MLFRIVSPYVTSCLFVRIYDWKHRTIIKSLVQMNGTRNRGEGIA